MGVFPQYFGFFANEFRDDAIGHQMQPDLAKMKKTFPLGLLGYPWSKLTSEQALLFAQRAGMPLAILRLPQTNLSSTGYSPPGDPAVRLFAAAIQCEVLPEGFTFRSSNEAVDTLSRVAVAISLNPDRRFTIYHCCNPHLDPYDLEPADFGFYWPTVPYESFKRACQARGEDSPLHGHWAVLDHFAKYWFSRNKPQQRLPVCDRAIREDCPFPIEWMGTLGKPQAFPCLGWASSSGVAVRRPAKPPRLRQPGGPGPTFCRGVGRPLRVGLSRLDARGPEAAGPVAEGARGEAPRGQARRCRV